MSLKNVTFLVLVYVTLAFGASIQPAHYTNNLQDLQTFSFFTPNSSANSVNSELDSLRDYDPFTPEVSSISTSNFDVGRVVAQLARTAVDMFSNMQVTEDSLKNLLQLLAPLLSTYLGEYSKIILPVLNGVVSVVYRSIDLAH